MRLPSRANEACSDNFLPDGFSCIDWHPNILGILSQMSLRLIWCMSLMLAPLAGQTATAPRPSAVSFTLVPPDHPLLYRSFSDITTISISG